MSGANLPPSPGANPPAAPNALSQWTGVIDTLYKLSNVLSKAVTLAVGILLVGYGWLEQEASFWPWNWVAWLVGGCLLAALLVWVWSRWRQAHRPAWVNVVWKVF